MPVHSPFLRFEWKKLQREHILRGEWQQIITNQIHFAKKTIFELNDLCFAKFFGIHPPPLKRTKTATILLKGIVSKKKRRPSGGNTIADNFWYFKSFSRICRQRDLAEILRVLYSTTSVEWIWSGRTSYSHSWIYMKLVNVKTVSESSLASEMNWTANNMCSSMSNFLIKSWQSRNEVGCV